MELLQKHQGVSMIDKDIDQQTLESPEWIPPRLSRIALNETAKISGGEDTLGPGTETN